VGREHPWRTDGLILPEPVAVAPTGPITDAAVARLAGPGRQTLVLAVNAPLDAHLERCAFTGEPCRRWIDLSGPSRLVVLEHPQQDQVIAIGDDWFEVPVTPLSVCLAHPRWPVRLCIDGPDRVLSHALSLHAERPGNR